MWSQSAFQELGSLAAKTLCKTESLKCIDNNEAGYKVQKSPPLAFFFFFENEDMGHLNEQEGLKRKRYIYFKWQMQKCNEVVVLNVKRLAKIIGN